jgi:hypothetical protein
VVVPWPKYWGNLTHSEDVTDLLTDVVLVKKVTLKRSLILGLCRDLCELLGKSDFWELFSGSLEVNV